MDKTLPILQQEFIQNITDLINATCLPAFVIADVLKNALAVTQELAKQEYLADKAKWEEEQNANTRSEHESAD